LVWVIASICKGLQPTIRQSLTRGDASHRKADTGTGNRQVPGQLDGFECCLTLAHQLTLVGFFS